MKFRLQLALMLLSGWLAPKAPGSVVVTKLDPPRSIAAADLEPEGEGLFNMVAIDFDSDATVDFRIGYDFTGIGCLFNYPTQIVIRRQSYPWTTNVHGSVGALPLGSVLGSDFISSVSTNQYMWHIGNTNHDDQSFSYGDHRSVVLVVTDPGIIGVPPVVSGDPADKEGIIAAEFLIGTNKHYGYVHFDFRIEAGWYRGSGGYILGWAYETEPNTPILAAPIAVPPTPFRCGLRKQDAGVFDMSWRATPGATYRVQGAPTVAGPFTNFTPEIVPPSGADASPLVELVTFHGMQNFPAHFWRVVRTR